MLKTLLTLLFSKTFFQKIFVIFLVIALFFLLKDFIGLILITFVFSYLILEMAEFFYEKIEEYRVTHNNFFTKFEKFSSINVITTVIYIIFIIMLSWVILSIFPKIAWELEKLLQQLPQIAHSIQWLIDNFEESTGIATDFELNIQDYIGEFNIQNTWQELVHYITNTSWFLVKFLLGIILSYVFIIDRNEVFSFLRKLNNGNFAFIYKEFRYIWNKFLYGFWRVFKAQWVIALVNAWLTMLGLLIIWYLFHHWHFPYIFLLSLIVFIFWFIPVVGTFLSGMPILIIWYWFGWVHVVISVVVMIMVIHAFEAYFLNPKIVSSYMHFPVFITFITLLISEHLFGMIGLIIWVPILSIVLSIFWDIDQYISTVKIRYKALVNARKYSTIPEKK